MERPVLDASMQAALRPLSLDEALGLKDAGAQLLDVRDAIDFEGAHLRGALNIGLAGKYATWCGSMLSKDAPIVVIAEAGGEEEAVMRLGRIGFDNVAGYLRDGMQALAQRADLVAKIERITAGALAEMLAAGAPYVLDVRSDAEWASGHLAGAHHAPLPHLGERLSELPRDRPLVVHCEGGYRSAIAASLLAREGFDNVLDLVGGFKAWQASKLPVETGSVAAAPA
jgi:hydroxyacylglutathione hydrolase